MNRVVHCFKTFILECVLVLTAAVAEGAPFTNGSFESATVNPGGGLILNLGTGNTSITGWTVTSDNIDYIGGFWRASDGSRSLDLNGCSTGGISQTFDTTPGSQYEVKFDIAGEPFGPIIKHLRVSAAGTSTDFTFNSAGTTRSNMGWQERTLSFIASGSTTTLAFTSLDESCSGPALDNVRVMSQSTLEILGSSIFRPNGGSGSIEMGERYRVHANVVESNPSVNPVIVSGTVREEVLETRTLSLGDTQDFPLFNFSDALTPGVSRLFVSPRIAGVPFDYQHEWRWMGDLDGANRTCVDTFLDIVKGSFTDAGVEFLVKGALQNLVSGILSVDEFADFLYEIFESTKLVVPEGRYNYVIEAQDLHGSDLASIPSVLVRVPQYKKNQLKVYFVASAVQAVATAVGLFPPNPALLAWEGASFLFACSAYDIARDPDPNYKVLAVPISLNLPSLDALPPSSGKRLAETWRQALSYQIAMGTSLGKYEGAKAAGDQVWMLTQLEAARSFLGVLEQKLAVIHNLTEIVIRELEAQGVTLTREKLAAVKAELLQHGLPQIEKDILSQFGFTTEQIATAAQATSSFMDFLPLNWQETVRDGTDGIITSIETIADYLDERILQIDNDSDGVANDKDQCPDSSVNTPVIIDGCNSRVQDRADENGCTISVLIDECSSNAANHGQFVSCVAHLTNDLKKTGTITGKEKGAIQSCAARANVP